MRTAQQPNKCLLLLGLALCAVMIGDARELETIRPEQLSTRIDFWSVEDGLPHETITSVAQTADGYIWCGSFAGLTHFDGVSFETLSTEDYPDLKNFSLYRMLVDTQDRLWLMGWTGKLAYFEHEHLHLLTEADGMPPGGARRIRMDAEGTLWFLERKGSRFFSVRGDQVVEEAMAEFPANQVQDFLPGRETSWLIDNNNRLHRIDAQATSAAVDLSPIRPNLRPTYFFKTPQGTLGMTSGYGALKLVDHEWIEWAMDPTLINGSGVDFFEAGVSPAGQLWLSTYALGPITQGSGGSFKSVYEGPRGQRFIRDVYVDAEQNIWFATDLGLYRARQTTFRNFGKADGMEHTWVLSMAMDTEGNLWFANQVELYYQAEGSQHVEIAPSPGAVSPNCIYGLPSGGIVVGKLEGQVYTCINSEWTYLGNTKSRALSFCETGNGKLWIGTERGLWLWDGQNLNKVRQSGMPANAWVEAIKADRNGDPIATLRGHGLWQLSHEKWQQITPTDRPAFRNIHDFNFDTDGNLWAINQRNQIIHFDGEHWQNFDYDLTEDFVQLRGILPDSRGDLWLSSSNGVYQFNCEDFLAGNITRIDQTKRYYRKNGLGAATSSRSSSGILEDSEGRIWVATQGGASCTQIPQSRPTTNAPQSLPLIHAVTVDHTEHSHHDLHPLVIPAATEHLKIDYTATYVGTPEDAHFRYRLLGDSNQWINVGEQRFVVYPRPKPGKYLFELQVADCHGQWSPQLAQLPIQVEPFWWERTIVHLSVILIIIAIIAWAILARFRRLHALSKLQLGFSRQLAQTAEEERQKIASDIHDGLGQDLLALKSRIEIVGLRNTALQPELEPLFSDVTNTIRQAREISYDLHPANLKRLGLSSSLISLAERLSQSTSIRIDCQVETPINPLPPEIEINLYRIAQEALSNAIRYSQSPEILLSLQPLASGWRLIIQDYGIGTQIDATSSQGHGLQNMQERARLIEATFEWRSTPGKGTEIQIFIPNETN